MMKQSMDDEDHLNKPFVPLLFEKKNIYNVLLSILLIKACVGGKKYNFNHSTLVHNFIFHYFVSINFFIA